MMLCNKKELLEVNSGGGNTFFKLTSSVVALLQVQAQAPGMQAWEVEETHL